jgi:hypothetical protein
MAYQPPVHSFIVLVLSLTIFILFYSSFICGGVRFMPPLDATKKTKLLEKWSLFGRMDLTWL